MPESASAGTVSVDVVPNGDQFEARLREVVLPAGVSVGRELARALGDQITSGVSNAVAGGVTDGGRKGVAAATKAGGSLGDAFATAWRQVVADRTGNLAIGPGDAESARQGEESAAAFGDAFRARVDATLRDLPDIHVDADTAEADASLERLRVSVAELGAASPNVRVSVDDGDATAKLTALNAQVRTLGTARPTITPQVNTRAAQQQLGSVRTSINQVGDDAAWSRLRDHVRDTAILLGAALVPAAVAAGVAVAGIGLAALGVGAGLGVTVLGLHGITGAVQALNTQQQDAATAAATATQRQEAEASAADQLTSAVASLANTRANAASQQQQATERVTTAEESYHQALDAERTAQQAVTQARVAAKQAMVDLNNSVKDGALAQRQAALDVQTAKIALDQTLANPASSALQRQQAQLTYEQAEQQVTDLSVAQQRLVAQQQAATKAGVDGSTQVVAARQQEQQATVQAEQAARDLTDARRAQADQARQSAFEIAQAQQSVVSAQRAVKEASDSAGAAALASGAAVDTAFSKLSPQGQEFATFIHDISGSVRDIQHSASDGLLPGVQQGLVTLLSYSGPIKSFFGQVGTEVGNLFARDMVALNDPDWRKFFTFLSGEAGPALRGTNTVVTNLGTSLANLIVAAAPLEHEFGAGLISFTDKLVTGSEHLSSNPGFQEFLADARRDGPLVAHTLHDLADAIVHIAQGLEPVGRLDLGIIDTFAKALDALPVPLVSALGAGITGVVVGMKAFNLGGHAVGVVTKAWAEGQKLLNTALGRQATLVDQAATPESKATASKREATTATNALTGALRDATTATTDLTVALRELGTALVPVAPDADQAATATGGFATSADEAATAASEAAVATDEFYTALAEVGPEADAAAGELGGLTVAEDAAKESAGGVKGALGGLTSFLGGPWGIALGAGATLLSFFLGTTDDTSQHVKELTDALNQASTAAKQLGTDGGKAFSDLVASNSDLQDLVIALKQVGVAPQVLQSALAGDGNASQTTLVALQQRLASLQQAKLTGQGNAVTAAIGLGSGPVGPFNPALDVAITQAQDQVKAFQAQEAAEQKTTQATQGLTTATDGLSAAQLHQLGLTQAATPAQIAYAQAIQTIYSASSSAADKLSALQLAEQQLDEQTAKGQIQSAQSADAAEAWQAALDGVTSSVAENGTKLGIKTAAERANTDAVKAAIELARDQYNQAVVDADGNQALIAKATDAYNKQIDALEGVAAKAHLSATQVQNLVDQYGKIPTTVDFDFGTTGFDKVSDQFNSLIIQEMAATERVDIKTAAAQFNQQHHYLQAQAEGGPIVGPGTGTSDSVLLWGSNGEWVEPTSSVDYYGPAVMKGLQDKTIPRELFGYLGSYSAGGRVGPFGALGTPVGVRVAQALAVGGPVAPYRYLPANLMPRVMPLPPVAAVVAPQQPAGVGGRARSPLTIENYYAAGDDPHQIAADLDWRMRSGGR